MRVLLLDNFRGPETGETLWQPGETHDTSEAIAEMLIRDGKAEAADDAAVEVAAELDATPEAEPARKGRKHKAE